MIKYYRKLFTYLFITFALLNKNVHCNADSIDLQTNDLPQAPPKFILRLSPYFGVPFSTSEISLRCRVECYPECQIQWFKNNVPIDNETDDKYFIKTNYLPANPIVGDRECVASILNFNMSAWPNQQLDIYHDNAEYSCVSSSNTAGPGVRSTTFFKVEYPPENIKVSPTTIVVEENTMPPKVFCSANSYPQPLFEWSRNGMVLATGKVLIIDKLLQKTDSGTYTCTASNRHGSLAADVFINIIYKPDCIISREEIDGKDTLICMATGNPSIFNFSWSIKNESDGQFIEVDNIQQDGDRSYQILQNIDQGMKTYRCVAGNTVGMGKICEINVDA